MLLAIFATLCLIVCGILAASSFIVSKRPDAKQMIDKLVPAQGAAGLVLLILGLISLLWVLFHLGAVFALPLRLLVELILRLFVTLALGFLMSFSLLSTYLFSKSEAAMKSGESLRARLASIQVPLGIAGIVIGVWSLISLLIL